MANKTFTPTKFYQAAWLCYINGLEIPVNGVDISYGVWQMPTANITMTPHPIIERIGEQDRLQIALFFLDEFIEPANPQFRLMGEFEVIGWSYASSSNGRSLVLHCVSQIQIFKQIRFSKLSAYNEKVKRKDAGEYLNPFTGENNLDGVDAGYTGSVTDNFESELDTTVDAGAAENVSAAAVKPYTVDILKSSPISRPIDLVLFVLKSILRPVASPSKNDLEKINAELDKPGITDAERDALNAKVESLNELAVSNDAYAKSQQKLSRAQAGVIMKNFFARWMKMVGFHKRWVALPLFEDDYTGGGIFPLIKETGGYKALRALKKHAGSRAGNAWDMFMRVYTKMYMEVAMIPSPPAVGVQKIVGNIVGKEAKGDSNFRGLANFFVKPQCFVSLAPMCNVFFPSMVERISFTENYMEQPTRVKMRGGRGSSMARKLSSGTGPLFRKLVQQELSSGFPWAVYKRMQQYIKAPGSNEDNFIISSEETYKGPVIRELSTPPWIRNIQKSYSGTKKSSGPKAGTYNGVEIPDEAIAELQNTPQADTTVKPKNKSVKFTKGAKALLAMYTKYEYYRARYEARQSSAGSNFNPYAVPGFPGVVFDSKMSGLHLIGYIGSVQHRWVAGGDTPTMSTSIIMSFTRTLVENSRDQVKEPLSTVRDILQDPEKASTFYDSLFFRKDPDILTTTGKAVVYNQDDVLQYEDTDRLILAPTEQYKAAFDNYDDAMRLISRPVCTLEEYVELWHNKPIDTLIKDNVLQGKNTSFYSKLRDPTPDKETGGAVFWSRIYKLKQGTGIDPGSKFTNVSDDEERSPTGTGTDGWRPMDDTHGDIPQTRYDWDTTLELYRKILYSSDGHIAFQE